MFKTPLPNPTLWNGPTIGLLSRQNVLVNGGWWHDNRILAATGQGLEKEEKHAWEGWWNDRIVELVRLSIKQPDALCVLLTGRAERGFADIVRRMVASKSLDFDMVGLKPLVSPTSQPFQSTMHFKQLFLDALVETYSQAAEIRVYEDRPKHVKGFRDFFHEYNRRQSLAPTRGPLQADVIQVADSSRYLDPVVEVAEVQHMINTHNDQVTKQSDLQRHHESLRIKKTVFFTSYMIGPDDTRKLLRLCGLAADKTDHDLKIHANNILICPRPCPPSVLEKVGGMGSRMMWEVTGTACFEQSIWAARLRPIPSTATFHTDNPVPLVVVALRKGARPMDAGKIDNWQPVLADKSFVFETIVGERVILRIEPEDPHEDEYESLFANKAAKRKHVGGDQTGAPRHAHGPHGGRNESRGFHSASAAGGGRGLGRGGGRAGRGRSRGGGGRGARARGGLGYRSLDDVEPRSQRPAHHEVDYDDVHAPPQRPAMQARAAAVQASHGGTVQQSYY